MEWVAIVTGVALLQYCVFSMQVGQQRAAHGVKAPTMSGHPDFERALRVQQNTLEQLVVFVPSLWLFAWWVSPYWAAGVGLLFPIGRQIYRGAYMNDPSSRSLGFVIGFLTTMVLLIGAVGMAIWRLL